MAHCCKAFSYNESNLNNVTVNQIEITFDREPTSDESKYCSKLYWFQTVRADMHALAILCRSGWTNTPALFIIRQC